MSFRWVFDDSIKDSDIDEAFCKTNGFNYLLFLKYFCQHPILIFINEIFNNSNISRIPINSLAVFLRELVQTLGYKKTYVPHKSKNLVAFLNFDDKDIEICIKELRTLFPFLNDIEIKLLCYRLRQDKPDLLQRIYQMFRTTSIKQTHKKKEK